jgi:hypothetical protein
MKLSEIVKYLNLLESSELDPSYDLITNRLDSITHVIQNYPLQFDSISIDLGNDLDGIKTAICKFNDTLEILKQRLRMEKEKQEPAYYKESFRFFEEEMCYEVNDHILKRRLRSDFDTDTAIRLRLKNYGDWRVPGLIIRPGQETFIEDMVPLDPLYLVDNNLDLLEPSIRNFTPEYQQRLRPYTINDYKNSEILTQLPNNQFGFVFAYNYFNFKPIEIIERFLTELYQKMRPGGTMLFTYNDCDFAPGIGAAEINWMCYTPGSRIKKIINSLGFEIIDNHIGPYDMAWFEIQKPGTIISLRAGQTLAKIMPK